MLFSTVQMHVPDGFLSIPVSFVLWVITIITIGYALRCVSREKVRESRRSLAGEAPAL